MKLHPVSILILFTVLASAHGAEPSRCLEALGSSGVSRDGTPIYGYRVVERYRHDAMAFTQGLLLRDGDLYESVGLYGHSELRRVDLASGDVLNRQPLAKSRFGEGLASDGRRLVQLTWRAGEGLIYRLSDLEPLGRFSYSGEGWGLAFDGRQFLLSDGTAKLRFLHGQSLEEQGEVEVHDGCGPVRLLNELEVINGKVWANVWMTDYLLVADPGDGRVLAWVDLSGLLAAEDRNPNTDVLNGIAYDPADRSLLLTGKRWPWLYRVRLRARR